MAGSYSAYSAKLYCVRPGFRIWSADNQGKVKETLVFKTQIQENQCWLDILPSTLQSTVGELDNINFGRIYPYVNKWLVTYHGAALYVLNPMSGKLLAFQKNFGDILSCSVCAEEIFILRGKCSRPIVRLALKPLAIFDAGEFQMKFTVWLIVILFCFPLIVGW